MFWLFPSLAYQINIVSKNHEFNEPQPLIRLIAAVLPRDLVFNPRYPALGWFSLPNIWFMQIGLVAVTPLVDAILLYSLILGHAAGIWYWFAAVLGLDLFLAMLACWMEREPLHRAFLILPMRFVYRPLLAWVIWKSIFHAVRGAFVTWGKLERTASVPSGA